jgi:hypothetical protein
MISKTAIITWTGALIDLANPDPNDIKYEDIAFALSRQYRFRGGLGCNYSVAQHCVFVSNWAGLTEDEQRWALLHDAGEAYLCDLPQPAKRISTLGVVYDWVERQILDAIAKKFGIPDKAVYSDSVKDAARRIVAWEVKRLCRNRQWLAMAEKDPAAWARIWGDYSVADKALGVLGKTQRRAWSDEMSRRAWIERARQLKLIG